MIPNLLAFPIAPGPGLVISSDRQLSDAGHCWSDDEIILFTPSPRVPRLMDEWEQARALSGF